MRRTARLPFLALALLGALSLAACGDATPTDARGPDAPETGGGIALEGAGWDGSEGARVDPTQPSDRVRVVAFLKPT